MSTRVTNRLNKHYSKHRELHKKLKEHADDIIRSEKFQSTRMCIQHGSIPVYRHCMDVAKQALIISRKLPFKINERELVRGALLHDYFLYDWHDKNRDNFKRFHGFHHAGTALRNASLDYELTDREKDIIKKHMFPLNIKPPMCREAWIVNIADKYCSTLETLKIRKGSGQIYINLNKKNEKHL